MAGRTFLMLVREISTNQGKTGLVAADLTLSYVRAGAVAVAVNTSDLAAVDSAHSDGGVKEVHATNHPGVYRVDLPAAAEASGVEEVIVTLTASGCYAAHRNMAIQSPREVMNWVIGQRRMAGDGVPGGAYGAYGYQVTIAEHDDPNTIWKTLDVDHPQTPSKVDPA